jgi:uncharacterized GH25 family protein/ketosteroid isomerase-like protein
MPNDRRASTRRLRLVAAVPCAALLWAAPLRAHDFWLVPNAFRVAPGGALVVRGQTSSAFPTSLSAVALDRIASASLVGAAGAERLVELSHAGSSLVVRHRPRGAGQRIVAMTLRPRSLRESPESFRRYLVLEGAPEALERYERERLLPKDSITRRYAKYAKAVVEVGAGGPRAFDRIVGHPLELVPLRDPSALRAGDTLPVRLLFRGAPMRGARLHAGAAPSVAPVSKDAAHDSTAHDPTFTTDSTGVARVVVGAGGVWNVRTLQIVQADRGSGADWDVHWATLVFSPEPGASVRAQPAAGDSAEVARTVGRFHEALARGDSAAALALLAPGATILESGGVETVAEYRAHHLPADIAFARAVPNVRGPVRVTVRGDVAWAASTSETKGEYRGRAVNSVGAELMVLTRDAAGWRIGAIHWSSRARRQ